MAEILPGFTFSCRKNGILAMFYGIAFFNWDRSIYCIYCCADDGKRSNTEYFRLVKDYLKNYYQASIYFYTNNIVIILYFVYIHNQR